MARQKGFVRKETLIPIISNGSYIKNGITNPEG